jgi:N-acyl-D-amino-acid deacylase
VAFDWLIRGGVLLAGSGAPPARAAVAVAGDRIVAVAPTLAGEARRTVDARGLIVAPGFIDMHAHSDFSLLAVPRPRPRCARASPPR